MKDTAKIIVGKLKYNDDGYYEIHNERGKFNFSKLLDKVYYSPKSYYINLCIMEGCKIIFNEDGGLYKRIDNDGINSYYILGDNLEEKLFNNTEKNLYFIIDTEAVGGKDYGQFYTDC